MNDAELVQKIKEIGANEDAARNFLLNSLKSGEITIGQITDVLDKPSDDFPLGLRFDDSTYIVISPSFITSVITDFKRMNGNKQAFCC